MKETKQANYSTNFILVTLYSKETEAGFFSILIDTIPLFLSSDIFFTNKWPPNVCPYV